ncbi:MAG: ammonia-forming cytochrome c nitrite reductase subunit c552 [Lachnospiraceae bacterium]|nr:ammonia-forming cytochrome c nitrite reductase subunit c552 [Lachnospiraceae bacterium]
MADKEKIKNYAVRIGAVLVCSAAFVGISSGLQTAADGAGKKLPGEIEYKQAEAPAAANENGVVTADEWAEIYPEIVASYKANDDNSYRVDYLEQDPYIADLYEGFGFAKDYTSAIGHTYTLEDVSGTERPHPLANCLTCKTPDYTKLVNDMGVEAYQLDFEETFAQMNENISCYNCHENQAGNGGKLVVTHSYIANALGDEMQNVNAAVLACGQCHIEYYFDPETKATSVPYDSVAAMDPEKMLAYYNEIGFSDWTQESTGTGLVKAQHPEFETFMNGSVHASALNCADCHMATSVSGEGVTYTSHKWESPLANQAILDTCVQCHGNTDMTEKVHAIQEEVTAREREVGEKIAVLKNTLADAVAAGEMSEDELNEIRSLYRDAQWYWDYVYVENSEGAHNSSLAKGCLEKSEALVDEAMGLFEA